MSYFNGSDHSDTLEDIEEEDEEEEEELEVGTSEEDEIIIEGSHDHHDLEDLDDDPTNWLAPEDEEDDGTSNVDVISPEQELFSLMQQLDDERNCILREAEEENKQRKWFYDQLEVISSKIDNIPIPEQYNLQTDMTRRQLEYDAKQLTESLHEKLGTGDQIALRQSARVQRLRTIEAEMMELQKRRHQIQMAELSAAKNVLKDVAVNTIICGEVFVPKPGCDNNSYTSDKRMITSNTGKYLVCIATQTSDVVLQELPADGMEDGIPCTQNLSSMYHGAWPNVKDEDEIRESDVATTHHPDLASVMSFNSETSGRQPPPAIEFVEPPPPSSQQLGTRVEMVYSLLSMLGTHDKDDMSRTLLAMSSSQDSCIAMRQSGCLPLLIQLLHGSDKDSGLLGNTRGSKPARARASAALHNIVHSHPDDKRGRREARVLRLLEQIRAHCDQLRSDSGEEDDALNDGANAAEIDHQPGPAIAALMKLSFDEEHRHAICTLGGLQAIAELLQVDNDVYGNTTEQVNITMRRYACMSLTNLTFGDGTNKALLCSMRGAMAALVDQLNSSNEDLCQVAASVLRNLSWRADLASKKILREVNAVKTLTVASMKVKKEPTFKSILSALWNLSAHCTENKADICAVDNALEFLVSILTYKSPSKTLAIIENGGGILRNVSSHIAVREDYRKVLRQHGCLQILLKHLRSPSLTIVSNACGTLWNLSARCPEDQQALWEMGAVSMLRNLVHSKHKMISMGSAAALKNLLSARPNLKNIDFDRHSQSGRPSLHVRKQRALEAELDPNLAETCDNVDSPRESPNIQNKENDNRRFVLSNTSKPGDSDSPRRPLIRGVLCRRGSSEGVNVLDNRLRSPQRVARSGSQDSVGSTHSDISHDRSRVHNMLAKSSRLLYERQGGSLERKRENGLHRVSSDGNCDNAHHPKNRIVQAMQEVAMHVGLNPAANEIKDPPRNMRALLLQNTQAKAGPNSPRNILCSNSHKSNSSNDVSEEPINYSLKYPGQSNKESHTFPLNNRHLAKVNNFMPPNGPGVRPSVYMVHNRFPDPSCSRQVPSLFNQQTRHPAPQSTNFGSYAETDLDSVDQPTNFSLRYAEQTDDEYQEQPINYSVRYQESDPHCADCKLEEARYLNDQMEQDMTTIHGDQMTTFCTEGTPYLSTATSLTDLVGAVKAENGDNATDYREAPEDEMQDYGNKYSEEKELHEANNFHDDQPRNFAIKEPEDHDFAPRDNNGAMDQTKTYNEEGTPVCFSRVSSLSSLHSSEARDHPDNRANVLQSIEENEKSDAMTGSVIEKSSIKSPDNREMNSEGRSGVLKANGSFNSEKEHKTVTFDDNHHVEETPLMFSRCSSLGSLSSFDAQSVHSSVVSEYSRRASEVVSPSELPDSPSETMPPSPKRTRSPGPKLNLDEDDSEDDTTKEFTDVAVSQAQLIKPLKNLISHLKSDSSTSTKVESPTVYAEEGPPPAFSDTNSILSALTIDEGENANIITRQEIRSFAEEISNMEDTERDEDEEDIEHNNAPTDDKDSSMSEVSEGEEDILAQCINLAMPLPNNSSRKMRKSSSDNALKKKNGLSKIDNLGTNKTKLPTKSVNFTNNSLKTDKTNSKNKLQEEHNKSAQNPISESVLRNTYLANYDIGNDTAKSYATEGTPLNFSSANSLTDLSNIGIASDGDAKPEAPQNPHDESKSDNSSLCEESEDILLTEVIQAAMPKSRVARRLNLEAQQNKNLGANANKSKTNAFQPLRTSSHINSSYPTDGGDVMKTYAEEGTPINFSTATSLSDLTMESSDDWRNSVGHSGVHSTAAVLGAANDSVFLATDPADSPRVYHVEDTPETFSCNDSLSSLSVTDDDMLSGDKFMLGAKNSFSPKQKNQPPYRNNKTEKESNIDQAKKFEVENTPTCFSISSSLSSLTSTDHTGPHNVNVQVIKEGQVPFELEDTPAIFSRNSSLSSLSIESSNNYDPTPSEQALLDECISSAMPKSRGKEQPKRHILSPNKSKIATRGGVDLPRSQQERPSTRTLSYSCSDTSAIERATPKHNAYQGWRREPAKSCDEASPPSPSSNRFGWKRSQSQDGNSFSGSVASSHSPNSDQSRNNIRRPFLGTPETVKKNPLYVKDNKLLEEAEQNRQINNRGSASMTDSTSSNEKVDSEKSVSEETVFLDVTKSGSQNETTSYDDLMKTSFPKDMAPDTDDDILDADDLEDDYSAHDSESDKTIAAKNKTLEYNANYNDSSLVSGECSFEEEITPEDERLLEANASLVVSELATNHNMIGSTQDEDLFIENETLSLVSNDYTSDTASEISNSWSLNSEKISEQSNSNNSKEENKSQRGPRVLKPGDKKPIEVPKENEKGIRGKRKPLYSRSASTPTALSPRSKQVIAKISPNKTPSVVKNNNQTGLKRPSPRQPTQTTANTARPPSKPTYTRSSSLPRTPLSNITSKSPARSTNANQSKSAISKELNLKPKINTAERPRPIVKQATFTKDTVAHKNTPTIASEGDVNQNKDQTDKVKLREKRRSSENTSFKRNSFGSTGSRNSSEINSSWAQSLDGFNMMVDTSKENGYEAPYKQIHMQRGSKDAPASMKRTINNTNTSPANKKVSNIARPINSAASNKSPLGSKTALNKSGSGTNLRKTTSGTSLTKTNSGSSLNKCGSNTNLKKMANGSKSELKKSDSNASIKTNSRPGTPNGRRLSNGSTSTSRKSDSSTPTKIVTTPTSDTKKPPTGSVGKKQVPSKIASLWKKEENGQENSPTKESSSRLPTANNKSATKPATPKRTSSLQNGNGVKIKTPPQKSPSQNLTVPNKPSPDGICKSSTYDKITIVSGEAETEDLNGQINASSLEEVSDPANTTVNSVFNLTDNSSDHNSMDSLNACHLVNSGTWKKKKGSSNHSLQLPNADETCRSSGSVSSVSDSVKDDASLNGPLGTDVTGYGEIWIKHGEKTKSGKNKDKPKKESKSMAQSIKSTLFGKKPGLSKIFGSQKSKNPPKKESEKTLSAKPLHQESRTSPSAIVPPFNYSPPVNTPPTPKISDIQDNVQNNDTNNDNNQNKKSSLPTPAKHATKTEMLLARRRSYLSSKNDVNSEDDSKMPCMVTTV
ncbi:hypothetical protein SNE40_013282 [Patella caerulea]|uniref:Adenomatous polyposis coli protein n=1 Tax=Patella caerulea TaxID=87958 RepID=A0AAN8PKX9_PATCE